MPDMYAVWHPQTVKQHTTIYQPGTTAVAVLQKQSVVFYALRVEAIKENDREKWASISLYKAPRFILLFLCTKLPAKRVAGSGKLYLVFSQLKTEG